MILCSSASKDAGIKVWVWAFFFFCAIREVWITFYKSLRWLNKIYFGKERCASYGNWGLGVALLKERKHSHRYWDMRKCSTSWKNSGPSIWLVYKTWERKGKHRGRGRGGSHLWRILNIIKRHLDFMLKMVGNHYDFSTVMEISSICILCNLVTLSIL